MSANKPFTRGELLDGAGNIARKYGLTIDETRRLLNHSDMEEILDEVEAWRAANACAAASPLTRGYLLAKL